MRALTTLVGTNQDFDPMTILATLGKGAKVVAFLKEQVIFFQGDPADAVFFVQKGEIKLSVVSRFGKEAVLGISHKGEFFGEGGLAGQPLRIGSATATIDCELLEIDNETMMLALQREPTLSDMFVAFLLAQNIRHHEALVDQLFDTSEKRLARVLLLLAQFGKEDTPKAVIPKVSQETLACMACTTRAGVSFLMKKFRDSGFVVSTNNGLEIHNSLLSIVLHD
jgi:CRP/FNR family cyclic AMP-dependent transcriptional regulator